MYNERGYAGWGKRIGQNCVFTLSRGSSSLHDVKSLGIY